jgi:hypothetical protein
MTSITATSIQMGGVPIATGSVTLTPVDAKGKPIPFVTGGGGLNSAHPFTCRVQNGAITGICQVPDSKLTTPANISYSIQVSSTAGQRAFVLNAVPNITGSVWALDEFAPAANTTNIEPIQVSYGTAAPSETCVAPSFYVRNASGGLLYMCVNSEWILVTGSGGSASVTPEAMNSAVATLTGCTDPTKSWSPAANGCVSNTGPEGPKGDKGDTGSAGADGADGSAGPQGPKGDTGANGTSATVTVGTVTTGDEGTDASVTNAGTESAAVLNFTIPRGADGAQGSTGPKGDTGATGAKGDPGDQGPKGDTGDTGPAGTAASITVGTVTTGEPGSSASVTNSGTSSAAVLDFVIPQGEKGADGDDSTGAATLTADNTFTGVNTFSSSNGIVASKITGPTGGFIQLGNGSTKMAFGSSDNATDTSGTSVFVAMENGGFRPTSGSAKFAGLFAAPNIQGTCSGCLAYGILAAPRTNTLPGGTIKLAGFGTSTTDGRTWTELASVEFDGSFKSVPLAGTGTRCLEADSTGKIIPSDSACGTGATGPAGPSYWSCQPGLGDGLNTIATGTYIQWTCRNDTDSDVTITGISCIADAGSTTVSMTNGSDSALLSEAITCGTSYTAGTQSGTTTLAAGDFIKLTIAASGSKQVSVDVKGTL